MEKNDDFSKAVSDLLEFDREELGLPKPVLEMEDEDWDEVLASM